jgi:N-carbamoyl-L-amino-acid hydrolase
VEQNATIGVASRIWPHGRFRFDFSGQANHAGTTRMEDRSDPMLTYADTALAANRAARATGQRATFGRIAVEPNATNAVPSHVTAWLDARCATDEDLARLVDTISRHAADRAELDGTGMTMTAESVSAAISFSPTLSERIAQRHGWPVIPSQAGHDAGILAEAGVPSAMLFVRNPTGISHSPEEQAEMGDCLAGVTALADTLADIAT